MCPGRRQRKIVTGCTMPYQPDQERLWWPTILRWSALSSYRPCPENDCYARVWPICEGSLHKVTILQAGPGYGKTVWLYIYLTRCSVFLAMSTAPTLILGCSLRI